MPDKLAKDAQGNFYRIANDGTKTKLDKNEALKIAGQIYSARQSQQQTRPPADNYQSVIQGMQPKGVLGNPYVREAGLGAARGAGFPMGSSATDVVKQFGKGVYQTGSALLKDPLNAGKMIEGIAKQEEGDIGRIPHQIAQKDYPGAVGSASAAITRPLSLMMGSKSKLPTEIGSPFRTVLGEGSGARALVENMEKTGTDLSTHVNEVLGKTETSLEQSKNTLLTKMDSSQGASIAYNKAKTIADMKKIVSSLPAGADKPAAIQRLFKQLSPTGNFSAAEFSKLAQELETESGPVADAMKKFVDVKLSSMAAVKGLGVQWTATKAMTENFAKQVSHPAIQEIRNSTGAAAIKPFESLLGQKTFAKTLTNLGVDQSKISEATRLAQAGKLAQKISQPSKWDVVVLASMNPKVAGLRMAAPAILRNYAQYGFDFSKWTGVRAAPTAMGAVVAAGAGRSSASEGEETVQ